MSIETFQPQPWPRRLGLAGRWVAEIHPEGMHIRDGAQQRVCPVLDVEARVQPGWFWSRVILSAPENQVLAGLSHGHAKRLLAALERQKAAALGRLNADLQADYDVLAPVWQAWERELHADRYLAARDRERMIGQVEAMRARMDAAQARACNPHAQGWAITARLADVLRSLQGTTVRPKELLAKRNKDFVESELLRWRSFFDHCEERPLTDEQARAAITFEENTLLVAAAGSGKTSTVVGKVAYALVKGIARPEEILCLAFNKKAAEEIGQRVTKRLTDMQNESCPIDPAIKRKLVELVSNGIQIESRTFHSLGLKIIRDVERNKTLVSKEAENKQRVQRAIERCLHEPRFAEQWLQLQTVARFARPADTRFHNEKEYLEYLRGMWRQRKFGRKAQGGTEGILTLGSAKPVASFEEVAISNWLYVMGVDFEYEAPYAPGAALLCPGRTWTPDFTYRVRDEQGEHVIVHEHFALNAKGKAPAFFQDPARYVDEAKRKKAVLSQLDARHFWTTSADYLDGTLFDKLRTHLEKVGVRMQPRSPEEVLTRLKQIGQVPDNALIERAVSQIRQNGWEAATLAAHLPAQPEPARARLFLDVVWPVAETVNALLEADKRVDYDEMIRRALVHLRQDPALLPFRFILADEFQDTAPGRGDVVRRMLHAREDSFFFAVGDDWQAINRFAGSDLQFFHAFGEQFNRRARADQHCALTQTFRSNQGIADVARHFVLKNKSQLPKQVVASDKRRHGVIDVRMYRDDQEVMQKVEETLARWVERHPVGTKPSVFLLGRYSEKHAGGLRAEQIKELNARWADRITLFEARKGKDQSPVMSMYMTMHKSKGLQADYVLVVGLFRAEHDWFCFPSEREDDPLLQLVLPPKEALADADERRLFYVALTRAKHQVVLLAQEQYPSPYALELLHDHRDGTVLFNGTEELPPQCPVCRNGLVFARYQAKSEQPFYACSDRWGCGKTWSTWPPVNVVAKPTAMPGVSASGRRSTRKKHR